MEFITKSTAETQKLGEKIGTSLKGGEVIALSGELGAGKTTFVQGLAKGLGIDSNITSPTYIIMRTYEFEDKKKSQKSLYHVDLYRLEKNVDREVQELGIPDLWERENSIFVIEWSERLKSLPVSTKKISIELLSDDTRKIYL